MKLSDDEARALEGLERALRTEEPRLHARLRDMRPGGLTAWQVVLGLVSGIGLGLGLATAPWPRCRCCCGSAPVSPWPRRRWPLSGGCAGTTAGTAPAAGPRRIAPAHAANVGCLPDHPGGGFSG